MSRREEVEKQLADIDFANSDYEGNWYAVRPLARTLADEVDARDAVITKLLEVIKPTDEDDRLREFSNAACDRYGIKQRLYNRAIKIAGRKK